MIYQRIFKNSLCCLLFLCVNISNAQTYDITWTDLVGVTASGNSLTKTASKAWGNGGAASENVLTGDGYVEITASETNTGRAFGLSSSNSNSHFNTINFAINLRADSKIRVFENGSAKGSLQNYSNGDIIRVERTGTTIEYKRNGNVFYTSSNSSSGNLIVDAALNHNGSTLNNAVASFDVGGGGGGPTCDDGIQNGDETGVDCGGACDACPTCDDGIQNGDETGVDCGGACDACPTCDDGVQNGDETGVDCGGSCDPCGGGATCDDGIQNGDETGVDCGGSCDPCGGGGATVWTQSGDDIRYSDGKVWIGNSALDVSSTDYNLFVEKGIITERLKVAIEGSGDWADYVFKKGYKVMTLEEVQNFIDENGHLPNVPSAEQVANDGIDVSKMFPTLLRQIEENKLYLIQMNEEIKHLKEENAKLKRQVSKQKK